MLRLAIDESVDGNIVRGLVRRNPAIDLWRAQDAGLSGADDPNILAWAAQENRVPVSMDRKTFPRHAYGRVDAGQPMSGVIMLRAILTVGSAIDELELLAVCYDPPDMIDRVEYLPMS